MEDKVSPREQFSYLLSERGHITIFIYTVNRQDQRPTRKVPVMSACMSLLVIH